MVLPAVERWFVVTYNEALPLVQTRGWLRTCGGFIGQEATHADTHERALHDFLDRPRARPCTRPRPDRVAFGKVLGAERRSDRSGAAAQPSVRSTVADRRHRALHRGPGRLLAQRNWDDHDADPTMVDLFRWHGSRGGRAPQRRPRRRHPLPRQLPRPDSRDVDRGADDVGVLPARRAAPDPPDPGTELGWWRLQRLRMRRLEGGSAAEVPPLFGSKTLMYFRPGFTPDRMGSTAQAVAYLASSPAARGAHL